MMLLSDGEYVVNDSEVVQAYVVIKMVWEIILLAYFLPNSYFFKLSIVQKKCDKQFTINLG